MIVAFRTSDGRHYLCAELDGRVVADRTAAGAWERWTLAHLGGDTYSLQSAHGRYLCAEPDGRVVADRSVVGIWESWRLVEAGAGVAFVSHHGRYLCAEGGGGGAVVADREKPGEWERFDPSEPLWGHPGAPGGHPDPLVGQLRIDGGAYVDGTGPRLPVFLHLGDLIGHGLLHGVPAILPALDQAAAWGYHGIRSWWQLHLTTGKWIPGPTEDGWNPLDNRERFAAILAAGAERGLTWHLAAGGTKGLSETRERELFSLLADAIHAVGPTHVALCEGINEARDTARDPTPAGVEQALAPVRSRHPQILSALSAYTGHEDRALLEAWAPDWAAHYQVHGFRDGRAHDKIRHIFSLGYDGEVPPVRRLGWQGEPWGPGRLVSAQANHHEIDADVMILGACMSALARQAWVVMSGPGVVYTDEPLDEMPGLPEVPSIVRRLPQDLMRWNILSHSGRSKRGQRIHAVRDDAPDVREDYVIDTATGRFVALRYGPPEQRHDFTRERVYWDEARYYDGRWGRVLGGVLS